MKFNIENIKNEFPIFKELINGLPLIYLDHAATSQKPKIILDKIQEYYKKINSNVHRGTYTLSEKSTFLMEQTRNKIHQFINSQYEHEIIFTKSATEAINLVAYGIQDKIKKNDEILISYLEHHSNIVPWQILAKKKQAKIQIIPIDNNGDLLLENLDQLINEKTKIIACTAISNALGVVNPINIIIKKAHEKNVKVLIDASQAISHYQIDVKKLNCDFLVFSGHKMYAPTGVGILYGKEKLLNEMCPYQSGGEMIKKVTFEKSTYQDLPFKFEAGTPNIEANIVLKYAIDFINSIGYNIIQKHENQLINYLTKELESLNFIKVYSKKAKKRAALISFNVLLNGISPFDVGSILNKEGISVRTGHHCSQPIMNFFQIPGTIRASFGIYSSKEDIKKLIQGLKKAYKMLK